MYRAWILTLALATLTAAPSSNSNVFRFPVAPLLAVGQAAPDSGAAPAVHFSLYAPVQKEPPVHIVGFWNDRSVVQFVLSNESTKPVILVKIDDVDIAPLGCGAVPWTATDERLSGFSNGGFPVRIAPHSRAVTSGVGFSRTATPHYPRLVFGVAQHSGAAYLQSQFGVTAVYFEDGSTWPADWSSDGHPPNHQNAFDLSLAESEAGKCTNVATVANALQSVKEVVFGPESPSVSSKADDDAGPPHLRFSCSLEGPRAVCRMPLRP